jgi:hypothetical protein
MYFIPSFSVLPDNEEDFKKHIPPFEKTLASYGYHQDARIDFFYAPAYTKDHWILLRYDVQKKAVTVLDSLYEYDSENMVGHSKLVCDQIDRLDMWLEVAGFESIVGTCQDPKTVRQPDCHSCGVVVCHLML